MGDGKGEGKGEGRPICTILLVEMVITVSPFSVLLCCRLSSFVNLSGVPSPLLLITSIRTHSLVGAPSDSDDLTDSGKGGRKGWAHEYPYMLHACVNWYMLIIDLDSCVEITGFVHTS